MTRHGGLGGPPNLLHASLPIRSENALPDSSSNRNNNDRIRDAVSAGRNISSFLADSLNQSTFANNEDSNLHLIAALAEELRSYQSPVEFMIGLVGDTGVGKSSLINSLLDEDNIAKTSGTGTSCTSFVTEYRQKRTGDNAIYTAEIERMDSGEIEDLLRQSVVDYRRYHLRQPGLFESSDEAPLQAKAKVGWDTLRAAFEGREGCTEIYFRNPSIDTDEIQRLVFRWKEEIVWPAGFDAQTTVLRHAEVRGLGAQLEGFLSARVWPFIKVVRIYLNADVLENGMVLVDLPGFHDVNSARVRITETRMYKCDEIFIVTDIGRAATNVGVENLLVRQLGRNFDGLRRSQGVAIICTKSEVLGRESEILRDVPHTDGFNPRVARDLKDQIDDAEYDSMPTAHLKAKRNDLFISARNQHVKRSLMTNYATQSRTRRIDVFCVSNTLYHFACGERIRLEKQIQARRRSSNVTERGMEAVNQMLVSSGICNLRDFCQGIPSRSQIAETKHFLNTRLTTLIEKVEMWLTASVAGVAANQHAAPEFLRELQEELKDSLDRSMETASEGLSDAKIEMLQRPLSQGRNRWEREALSTLNRLEGWHVASLSSFWSHEGAHATGARGHTDWNADILRAMVEDFQPSENLFLSRSERLFETLGNLVQEHLSHLRIRLGDPPGVDVFMRTFPRRVRELKHEIDTAATAFYDELQSSFHDLLNTHGTSYVMRHMRPMYNVIESGPGTKRRLLQRLNLQVTGDRRNPKLFQAITGLFISDISSLLEHTGEKLKTAADKCCEEIRDDLEISRGEDVSMADQDGGIVEMMFNMLEQAKTERDAAQREFEAGYPYKPAKASGINHPPPESGQTCERNPEILQTYLWLLRPEQAQPASWKHHNPHMSLHRAPLVRRLPLAMVEHLVPPLDQQSQIQYPREDALRRLSRSPHPYHRQQFELPHASERLETRASGVQVPLGRRNDADGYDKGQEGARFWPESYRESTNSDSGTEADDEHFLKGLPAPKLRPHKGLRGVDGNLSRSPSPLPSPAIQDSDGPRDPSGCSQKLDTPSSAWNADALRKVTQRHRRKLRVEVVRRITEAALLAFIAGMIWFNPEARQLIWLWRRELAIQSLITLSLISIYPFRLLRHINPSQPWARPFPIAIPVAFDPAPLLYPQIITILVSLLLSISSPAQLLPSIVLAIASLPIQLIPSIGGLEGLNIFHWLLSCLVILLPKTGNLTRLPQSSRLNETADPEILILLHPLHLALCETLRYLTTTSLLPAELQLLSISLIELLLLSSSPQAIIFKAVLWGGGIGVLVTCTNVLRWGITLARVPKWRFRRSTRPSVIRKSSLFWKLGESFSASGAISDSSDEESSGKWATRPPSSKLRLKTQVARPDQEPNDNASVSAIEPKVEHNFSNGSAYTEPNTMFNVRRRHTLPSLINTPITPNKKARSGRRKRSTSSSIQSFFSLTQAQATIRKWLYAGYVYSCILAIILGPVRKYIGTYALDGNEPIGWALGYLFGDLRWFRMEVVKANVQRWICLPPRNGENSCHLGWVEHTRHASLGEANTRLILCAYWLAIIVVGLAIVFRLSSIYEVDTRRKVFHFMMVGMLLPATYVDPTFTSLALGLMLAIFLLLDLFRASQLPPLSKSLAYFLAPYVDGRDLKGPVVISHIFLLVGCAVPLWLSLATLQRTGNDGFVGWEVATREVSMVSGVICVGLGDAAASLIGRRYGRHKWIWGGGKSIEGSVAFTTAVGLALVLAKAWIRIGGWRGNNDNGWVLTFGKVGVAATIASLTEAVLTGGNDNVVVPIVLWLCVKALDI